ncbi:hypothetical protein JCM10450v2_001619 [Rhodotorula kratochvilovae]
MLLRPLARHLVFKALRLRAPLPASGPPARLLPTRLSSSLPSPSANPDTEEADASPAPERPKPKGKAKTQPKPRKRKELPPLNEDDLDESFVRGSGPGGQATNKTSNAVSLIHRPTGLRVHCHETRSRETNRKLARRILREKLDQLLSPPGESAKELEAARERQKKEAKRRKSRRKAEEKKGAARGGAVAEGEEAEEEWEADGALQAEERPQR